MPELETVITDGLQNLDIGLIALDGSCPDLDDGGLLEDEGLDGASPIDPAFADELPLELDYETASEFAGQIPSFQQTALRADAALASPKSSSPKARRGPSSARKASSGKKSGRFGFWRSADKSE